MIRILILLLAFLPFLWGCSTTKTAPQSRIPTTQTNARRYETKEEIQVKIKRIEDLLIDDIDNVKLRLEVAALHLEIESFESALLHLEYLKSKEFTSDPRVYGSLASIYLKYEEYNQALENFKIFKSLLPQSSQTRKKVDKEISRIEFIIEARQNAYDIDLRPFSSDINTENSEYLPQFTLDDSTIIFTRRFFDQEDLFIARKTSEGYQVDAIEEINTLRNEGAHTISANGQILIFTHCDKKYGFGSCDLYKSTRSKEGRWSKPTNMGASINSREWDSQPSLSADGRKLFFASKRSGGKGGSDVWMSHLQIDNTWSIPQNVKAINTRLDDGSPFIHADGLTLYFRSKGYLGFGNFDLYKSSFTGKSWTTPINMGSPINTTGDDGALVVSLDGTRGYYATDQFEGKELKHLDLFEFDLPVPLRPTPMTFVSGRVQDESTGSPLSAQIKISYLDESGYSAEYLSNSNGEFLAAIPVGRPALLNIGADDYLFYSDHISFEEVKYGIDPYNLTISLSKIKSFDPETKKSEPVILKNIFFTSGSADLLPISQNEIAILYQLLKDRSDIQIEIIGHTDDVGSEENNLFLSEQRAKAVMSSLVAKGINPSRLKASGKGESHPIATNDTEEGKSINRRTEFVILN